MPKSDYFRFRKWVMNNRDPRNSPNLDAYLDIIAWDTNVAVVQHERKKLQAFFVVSRIKGSKKRRERLYRKLMRRKTKRKG